MKNLFPLGSRYRLCAMLVASSGLLWSQSSAVGHITGTVRGADGKVLVGALVQAVTPRGTLETRTNESGQFRFVQLVPNRIKVKVNAKGFAEFAADTLVVVNETTTLNVKLHSEASATVVVVAEPADTTDTAQAKTGLVTTFEKIDALPIVGNNFFDRVDQAIVRAPGADLFIIHGVDETQNNFQVDGVDATDQSFGGRSVKMNNDFIDQVQVLSGGISAKYGRFAGTVINTTTKSGGNEFQGSFRLDITDPKWNGVGKLPYYYELYHIPPPGKPKDNHFITQSYTFLGPVIKDTLFFAVAYQTISPLISYATTTNSPDFGGVPYKITQNDTIKDMKLDWQVNTSHRLSASWNEHTAANNNGSASNGYTTTLATLSGPALEKKGYWALGYTGQLRPDLLLDVKYNDTTSRSGGPGTGPTGGDTVPTWLSSSFPYDVLDNGFGSSQPITSHMKNLSANLTWFLQAAGEHQIEAGIQDFHYIRDSAAAKTPSGYVIYFNGYVPGATAPGLANRVLTANNAGATRLESWQAIHGEADTKVDSLYLNDTWKVDKNWSANLGLRYDKYKGDSKPEHNAYDFSALTPRLALNYDLRGDKAHVVFLSAAIYSGQITQGVLGAASVSQTPILNSYVYAGTGGANQGLGTDALTPSGGINWNAWGNGSGAVGQGNPQFTQDPLTNRNVFVDPNLKAPRSRELILGYRHELDGQSFTANLIRRWTDQFIDDIWYGNGMGPGLAKIVIANDPSGRQDYYGLELTYRRTFQNGLSVGGNLTWARTLENQGETNGASSASSPAHNFGNLIPDSQLQPYGPAPNLDRTVMANLDATYQWNLGPGQANVGLIGTYKGKSTPGFPQGFALTPAAVQAQGYAPYYYRQFPELGPQRDPSYYSFDLQMGYQWNLAQKVKPYLKLNVQNVLNQMAPVGRQWSGNVVDAGGNPYPADGTLASNKFLPDPTYGKPGIYQNPRTIQLVVGCRF